MRQQKTLDAAAKAKGVSVVPDTGLAPGMVNVIAQHGIDQFDTVDTVQLFVGGLPQVPEPPLGYQIAYSIEGMIDYYTTPSLVVRDGAPQQVTALSELETVHFAEPLGDARGVPHRRRPVDDGVSLRGHDPTAWNTRRSATPGTRASWRPFAASGCWTTPRWT